MKKRVDTVPVETAALIGGHGIATTKEKKKKVGLRVPPQQKRIASSKKGQEAARELIMSFKSECAF
jgi:hypothetical protein